jgi:hypothetical protein
MKIKHLLGIIGILIGALVLGCGGGNLGLQNVNSTQVYTTAGYTIDTAVQIRSSAQSTVSPSASSTATH